MVVSAAMLELVNLLLYCAQQLGVMLGVGAETVILIAYLFAMRDGSRDEKEEHFAHAVKRVLFVGLWLIILSGLAITALEFMGGEGGVVFAPAYLFKCVLIAGVLLLSLSVRGSSIPAGLLEGIAGGTWYALFVVHILAPVATWYTLVVIYALGLVGFMACWTALVLSLRGGKKIITIPVPVAKPVPVPAPILASAPAPIPVAAPVMMTVVESQVGPAFLPNAAPKFSVPPPPPTPRPLPPPPAPLMRAPAPIITTPPPAPGPGFLPMLAVATAGLPAMRLMPRSAEDLKTQHRAPAVRFG